MEGASAIAEVLFEITTLLEDSPLPCRNVWDNYRFITPSD